MKNILIFSHEFPPQAGGAGVVAQEYAKSLSSAGHNVTVLTKKRENLDHSTEYEIVAIKTRQKLWFLSYFEALNFNEFDLILLNDPASVFFAGLFFTKEQLGKSLVFLHGSEPELIFEKPTLAKRLCFFRLFYTSALRDCKEILAVSHFMKDKFITRSKLKKLAPKVKVVYSTVDRDIFYYEPDEAFRTNQNLSEHAKILLSVSRLIEGKGYFDKLKIFRELLSRSDEDWHWIIIGDGNYRITLEGLIESADLSDRIHLVGSMPRNELRAFYSNVDFFWLLSNLDESFGLVYLEAQECHCPVIARNRAGAVEAVRHGESGYLINSSEECIDILTKISTA